MNKTLKKIICICIVKVVISIMILPLILNASSLTDGARKTILNTVEDIEKNVDEIKYPGIKDKLIQLKKANPNWKFTLYYTDIDWNTAIYNETEGLHSRSLVQGKEGEWICDTCKTKVYDKGGWMCASKKAVAYLMDVRNYLNENYIFQFEELSYNPNTYTLSGIERILSGTFMYETSIRDYYNNPEFENITFAQAIMDAASISGVSPYHLASRMRQELGINGSNSIYGTYPGYEGYYNFYNISAYSGENPIENGLKYASNTQEGKYLLPWNDPVKAIKGGAIWIARNYIAAGQDTLYFEKFDVVSNGTSFYTHQYMQNIFAAKNEGNITYKAYKNLGILDTNFNFIIPIYENMPKELSKEPANKIELNEKVKVLGDNVILRQNPTTSSTILSVVAKNTVLTRLEKNVANANGYIWDKVKLEDGKTGYMASKYLGIVTEEHNDTNQTTNVEEQVISTPKEEKVYVNASNVYVRTNPGTSSAKIATLAKNTEVIRLEKNVANVNGYYWDKVKLANGKIGYMASKYLSTSIANTSQTIVGETVRVNAKNVILRQNPTTKSLVIGVLAKGITVTRLQKHVKYANGYYWDKVQLKNGRIGYVASKYLS